LLSTFCQKVLKGFWTFDQFPQDSLTIDEQPCVQILTDSYKVLYGRAPLFKPGQPQPGLNNFHYANKGIESVNCCLLESEKRLINLIYEKYLEQGIICGATQNSPLHCGSVKRFISLQL
jgi:hypothetical protein